MEISTATAVEDDVHDEKMKSAHVVFQYANAEATLLDDETNQRLLHKINLHVLP